MIMELGAENSLYTTLPEHTGQPRAEEDAMNYHYDKQPESYRIEPLMVMPNGQVIFHLAPVLPKHSRPASPNRKAQSLSWKSAVLVLLGAAAVVPGMLLAARLVTF